MRRFLPAGLVAVVLGGCSPPPIAPYCGPFISDGGAQCNPGEICNLRGDCVAPDLIIDGDAGTVEDVQTGLLWQQDWVDACPNDGWGDETGECTWQDAQTYCQNLSLGGFASGWRLPTPPELYTLINLDFLHSPVDPLDPVAFPGTQDWWYWTSSTSDGYAWVMNFLNGSPEKISIGPHADNPVYAVYDANVRCVR